MCFKSMLMLTAMFLLRLPGVQGGVSVTYSSTQVCGLKGASVVLPCRYDYSWVGHYEGGEWYEEKRGRVRGHSNSKYPDCSLKIDKLSDDQSGVYYFRFYTAFHPSWITARPGVTVSVTHLRVKEGAVVGKQNRTELTCSTSCSLSSNTQYVWYKNGQPLQDKTTASILLDSSRPIKQNSYSCAVRRYEAHRSPAVCAPSEQCWGVTYSSNSICALNGSSVDISCTYKYPRAHRINTTFWFKQQKSSRLPVDLSLDTDYQNHTEYVGNKENSCTLRLKDMRESHSGEYAFRFTTEQGGSYSGLPGVNISVTVLQVLIPPEAVKEGEKVTLTCNTTCILSNNPTFIWYKNGQPVTFKHTTRDNRLLLNPVSSEDVGSYSCAVKRHESLFSTDVFLKVRYKPKHVSVSISTGEIVEGSSVTLTCSSDANPPVHNYTWYMRTGAESLIRGTGDSISFNVTFDSSGLYYCEAENEVGSQNSTGVIVPSEEVTAIILPAIIIIFIILAVLLLLGIVCLRKQNAEIIADTRGTITDIQNDSGLVYSTVTARATTSDPAQRVPTPDQNDVQYASVQINRSKTQEVPLYSTVQKPQTSTQDDDVAYSSVQFLRGSAATRAEIDVIYSAVITP